MLLNLYAKGQTRVLAAGVPDPQRRAPKELGDAVQVVLGIAGWAGTAAGVAGIMVTGIMMAVSVKRGEGSEHLSRLGMVLGGCILVAAAGPTIAFFFNEAGGKGNG
ncbi:hypothetical protein [Streptomyces sp. RP5T]|uniref:hypothetical protein n=1 Tax=Streptomyces sp. RP5T TaxID=2490848 RepID=UPI000F652373|nr:hypothetical protein [Streptomyces sp. RP5T]RRR86566.1 hypothetical protein EHS43_04050 [Streptomyces sp. RP5T]